MVLWSTCTFALWPWEEILTWVFLRSQAEFFLQASSHLPCGVCFVYYNNLCCLYLLSVGVPFNSLLEVPRTCPPHPQQAYPSDADAILKTGHSDLLVPDFLLWNKLKLWQTSSKLDNKTYKLLPLPLSFFIIQVTYQQWLTDYPN